MNKNIDKSTKKGSKKSSKKEDMSKKKSTKSGTKTSKTAVAKTGKGSKKGKKSPNKLSLFLWKDKRSRARNMYFALIIVAILGASLMGYVNSKLNLIDFEDEIDPNISTSEVLYDEEDFEIMQAIDKAGSLNDYLYQWANNGGELYSSKNVINVLILGLDNIDAFTQGGRSDTIMLASLNKSTKKITLTSFFRDTWLYMNINDNDRYAKLNSSFFYGGANALIDTIESNMKIKIDHYVAVDFNSFVDIIDSLGGLTVEVQQYEAEYINRTSSQNIDYGENVKLNGEEALVFARIRKSDGDSDVSRTRRQRSVITALIDSAKGASLSQLNSAVNSLFAYVKTDLTKTQILSYGAQALANGWINYEIQEVILSDEEIFTTGYIGTSSVVLMDLPKAAQKVQTALYGDTNISLEEDRVSMFNYAPPGFYG